ncbi:polar flagellar hook-length control protein FliK [Alteromonas mediterranea MED64]|uniref:flagellar hook-length control protein FliK n=1 Tax=Alteromonas mediterranea TaxID=314275 RepID=UPI0003555FDE|nr:flagellar hook-length control protein FliK [Alteromonas mediterranea]AGP80981.1 polar flagellar hook-length control protein FliK [Alteromonas mediterranea MED64]AGP84820.1 polar flagellar hook-length control protein FliK [Alteromonas mediterranea U4]AGP88952.1 polar flagellar hook-length control protein FliK [Alteromonas mediterranea U7]AGP92806.1 polar flagellar hook-length control protein FliK [Alteromonas mediterranea U8]
MQQVAAQKTDIAALPFSASSTAKAVETGIGSQQDANSENNQAFNRLYQDAKASRSDFVLNDKSSQTPSSRAQDRAASEQMAKNAKDKDAGHTDLPDNHRVTDQADEYDSSAQATEAEAQQGRVRSEIEDTQETQESELAQQLVADGEAVEQRTVTEAKFVLGEGGKKDAEAGVITTPGTPDAKPIKEDEAEPDWIAYVETVVNGMAKGEQQSDNNKGNTPASQVAELVEDNVDVLSVNEAGKLWKLPENVDASDAPSLLAHFLTQLNSEGEASLEKFSDSALSHEAKQTLSALASLLSKQSSEGEHNGSDTSFEPSTIQQFSTDGEAESEDSLSALLAKLMESSSAEETSNPVDAGALASNELDAEALDLKELGTDELDAEALDLKELATDESLILSLIADELNNVQEEGAEESEALIDETLTELASDPTITQGVNGSVISRGETNSANAANAAGVSAQSSTNVQSAVIDQSQQATEIPSDLLTAISELSPQSAQKATEAFAERMVATMPSGQQQQAVKANIIAGINEFQQQVEQGREPGIDLSGIVADAAKDAAVSTEMVASMTAKVDSQASQFLNLMSQTQASAQHAILGLVAQTDTVMQENSQLRAEASKTQQQFEGFDKAVNIHKSEGQQQLNEKIRWMVNARNTMAEIRLDPPELGSMQVRVNVAGDAASVSFVVQSQQAKDALAEAMPKLRDMLSEQGIELGDAEVRKDNSSNNENGQQLAGEANQGRGERGENDGLDEMEGTRVIEQPVTRAAKGGIDFYA